MEPRCAGVSEQASPAAEEVVRKTQGLSATVWEKAEETVLDLGAAVLVLLVAGAVGVWWWMPWPWRLTC